MKECLCDGELVLHHSIWLVVQFVGQMHRGSCTDLHELGPACITLVVQSVEWSRRSQTIERQQSGCTGWKEP